MPGRDAMTGSQPPKQPHLLEFPDQTPIERLTTEKKTRGKRAVNRKGRAICRIMQHYGFNDEMLARIFGESKVTIVKVLTNHYHDDLSEDYQAAGREFQVKFPPRALAESPGRYFRYQHKRSREVDPIPGPSTANASSSGVRTVKKPRYPWPADNGEARPSVQDRRPVTPVAAAAQSAPFHRKSDNPIRSIVECQPLCQTLREHPVSASSSTLSESPATNQPNLLPLYRKPLPRLTRVLKIQALPLRWRLLQRIHLTQHSLRHRDPRAELSTFLQNVLGMDFSVHLDLLLAQGIDKQKLRIMARWSSDARQRFLHCLLEDGESLLRGKKGMSLFEIMSLESVIGELGK
ncbi:hypothetical protein B0H13DRAFT_2480123 [Mycena leptocephala]|nr:hypothetical protein B0H13DRAFT_2480123 [Mycena leptocephala]